MLSERHLLQMKQQLARGIVTAPVPSKKAQQGGKSEMTAPESPALKPKMLFRK
jgi:hypothetical protein